MTKIIYTETQIREIESNKYVDKCTTKQIRFTNEFKVELIKLSDRWLFYREIFDKLWFPEYITKSKIPERTYTRYKKIKKKNWLIWLIWNTKWRPKKEKIDITKMNLNEQNEYLKTKVAYLEEIHKTAYWHYP